MRADRVVRPYSVECEIFRWGGYQPPANRQLNSVKLMFP